MKIKLINLFFIIALMMNILHYGNGFSVNKYASLKNFTPTAQLHINNIKLVAKVINLVFLVNLNNEPFDNYILYEQYNLLAHYTSIKIKFNFFTGFNPILSNNVYRPPIFLF